MFRTPLLRLLCGLTAWLLMLSLLVTMRSRAQTQTRPAGSNSVPLPKLPGPVKKDRGGFPPIPTFKDIAREAGLTASHIAAPEAHYVIDSTSGGVGLFDCDNDGRLDVILINGSTVERFRAGGDPMVTLYHQEADGTFKDITKEAGLARRGWSMGVAV